MATNTPDHLAQAAAALETGDPQAAFQALRPLFGDAELGFQRARLAAGLRLLAQIGARLASEEFAAKTRAAAEAPDDVTALYHLGYELIEQDLSDVAAAVLTRANALQPGEQAIVSELVTALERGMRYREAREVLEAAPGLLQHSFTCRYLLAFNSLMSGGLECARRTAAQLRPGPEPAEQFMAARVNRALARCDALANLCSLDDQDLRGWHLALTGGVLLHRSPYGEEVMRGRYAFVQDTEERCLEGIRRAAAVLDALGLRVPQVFALPDRNSAVLAHAAARALALPLAPWPEQGSPEPGLIVAYDMDEQSEPVLRSLLEHRPGQVLWCHAACWTHDLPVAPDLTTFLHQYSRSPWGERVSYREEQAVTLPADTGPVEQIAERITGAALPPEELADLDELLALVRQAAAGPGEPLLAPLRREGRRERQWAGSPVPSARFG